MFAVVVVARVTVVVICSCWILLILKKYYCWAPWCAAPSNYLSQTHVFIIFERLASTKRWGPDRVVLLSLPPGARPSRIFARHLRILAFVARGVSVELTLFFPGRTPGPLWRLDSSESTPLPCVAHGFRVVHRWCPLAPSPFLFDALGQSWLCIVFASVERPLLIARRTPGPLQRPELSKSAPLPCVARVRIVYPMKTHMIWIVFICSSNSWIFGCFVEAKRLFLSFSSVWPRQYPHFTVYHMYHVPYLSYVLRVLYVSYVSYGSWMYLCICQNSPQKCDQLCCQYISCVS